MIERLLQLSIVKYRLSAFGTSRSWPRVASPLRRLELDHVRAHPRAPRLEKRTHYLSMFANIATLLGLLGTVAGLIEAFTAVAQANPAEKAELLSASISIAMNATAFGLITAIPLLFAYTVLQTKTTELVDSLEMAAVKFTNMIMERATVSGSH